MRLLLDNFMISMILSILVDTFFTRIFMPGQHLEIHNISVV